MSKALIAYFSASGVTASLAGRLASAIGADLFEIKPEVPYSSADMDWTNKKSRSSVEMNDRNARPAIQSKVGNMDQYDTVFIGFPIWWYREPSVIDTFMEAYDFGGKTIIAFATSGDSGMGDSAKNLQVLAKNAKVENGRRFSSSVSADELKTWADKWL